jgi:hypothetical protein
MSATIMRPAPATVRRRLSSPLYSAGTRQTVQLDRDGVLLGLAIRLQYRVTNGATGPTTPLWSTLARLLRRVEVLINGQDTTININGAHLASRHLMEFGTRPLGMDATVVLTNSAVTDYDIAVRLPFTLPPGAQRRDDCGLDLRGVQQAVLGITWGDASDLFGTTNGAVVSNVQAEITGHYLVNADPKARFWVRALDMQDIDNTTSNANLSVLLDRGSDLFWRNLHIATLRNNVAVQNILTGDIRWQAGSFLYDSRSPREVLADTILESPATYNEVPSSEQVYRLSRDYLGSITTLINGGALAGDLFLYLGTTYTSGTERISISREFMRPLRVG